jgi:hypothetical protein
VFSELKQGVSPRDSDIGQIGRDRLRLIIGSKRIPITPQLHQQAAACEPRADAKPVERERPLVCGKGRIERSKPALRGENNPTPPAWTEVGCRRRAFSYPDP